MQASLNTPEAFGQFLRELLGRVHVEAGHEVGALISCAYALAPGEEPYFLTGRCLFEHAPVPPRKHEYPTLLLEESWLGCDEAADLLVEIIRGKGYLGGKRLPSFHSVSVRRQLGARPSYTGWPEWVFGTTANRGGGTQRYAPPDPVVRPGYRPYSSGTQAIVDWIWRLPTKESPNQPHQDGLVMVVPDFRKRIKSADWRARRVIVELDGNESDVELQVLALCGGTHQPLTIGHSEQSFSLEVPPETERLELFLVRATGDLADNVTLYTAGAEFEAAAGEPTPEERAAVDLRGGESHELEFKPFVAPKDPKEYEIVRSIIAFANTDGGRLYIGVRDDGVPEGEAALCKESKKDAAAGWQLLADRVRHIVREKIKPVPEVNVVQVRVFDEPVIVVEIPTSSAAPFSTRQ